MILSTGFTRACSWVAVLFAVGSDPSFAQAPFTQLVIGTPTTELCDQYYRDQAAQNLNAAKAAGSKIPIFPLKFETKLASYSGNVIRLFAIDDTLGRAVVSDDTGDYWILDLATHKTLKFVDCTVRLGRRRLGAESVRVNKDFTKLIGQAASSVYVWDVNTGTSQNVIDLIIQSAARTKAASSGFRKWFSRPAPEPSYGRIDRVWFSDDGNRIAILPEDSNRLLIYDIEADRIVVDAPDFFKDKLHESLRLSHIPIYFDSSLSRLAYPLNDGSARLRFIDLSDNELRVLADVKIPSELNRSFLGSMNLSIDPTLTIASILDVDNRALLNLKTGEVVFSAKGLPPNSSYYSEDLSRFVYRPQGQHQGSSPIAIYEVSSPRQPILAVKKIGEFDQGEVTFSRNHKHMIIEEAVRAFQHHYRVLYVPIEKGAIPVELPFKIGIEHKVHFSPDEKQILFLASGGSIGGNIKIFDIETQTVFEADLFSAEERANSTKYCNLLRWSADGQTLLVSCSNLGVIQVKLAPI